jgi:dipeptidyl aminopeptidase/acylaminoacyl peptidase
MSNLMMREGGRHVTKTWRDSIVTLRLVAATLIAASLLPGMVLGQRVETTAYQRFDAYMNIRSLDAGGIVQPNWVTGANRFWYAAGSPDSLVILMVESASGRTTPLFDISKLRRALDAHLPSGVSGKGLPFATFEFVDSAGSEIRFQLGERSFRMTMEDYAIKAEPVHPGSITPMASAASSPSTGHTAFIRDHNVWIQPAGADTTLQVTFDGVSDQIEWGPSAAPPVASPDGSTLAVTRWDYRTVAHVPVIDYLADSIVVDWEEAPLPGGAGRSVDLYLLSLPSGERLEVPLDGPPERYVVPLLWSPSGDRLFFVRYDRTQQQVDLMVVDRRGNARVVIRESSETFVVGLPLLPRVRSSLALLKNNILWASERGGWNHLYLFDLDGRLTRQLTSGEWPVESVLAVDEERGWIYFSAHGDQERPYDTHIYRVSTKGGEPQRLTDAPGQHRAVFSPTRDHFVDVHSNIDRPSASDLRASDGTMIRTLEASHRTRFEEELGWSPPEEFIVTAADGETDLHGVLYLPANFDPDAKYPVIEFMRSGPDEAYAPRHFGQRSELHAFSQLGFVVLALDARGTPGRSKAFQDVVYRNFGRHEIADHAAALSQLFDRRPYMDSSRVGVFGHSWGGYFAVRALLTAPEVYHVGIAMAADGDLEDHRGNEMVIYMGTPDDNPEGYAHGSNTRYAGDLRGRLLLIHGVQDRHVPFSSTLILIDALIRAGRPYDLLLLPRGGHGFSGPHDSRYTLQAVRDYFTEHLLGNGTVWHGK